MLVITDGEPVLTEIALLVVPALVVGTVLVVSEPGAVVVIVIRLVSVTTEGDEPLPEPEPSPLPEPEPEPEP